VTDACGALERKIAYWADLQARAQDLAAAGLTPRQIMGRLLGKEGRITQISCGHISQINLIRALLNEERIRGSAGTDQKGIENHA
jgi:hypothetical protein